ncbi:polysaccharide biosynthesis C-terminal domain-containing protein [candidate division CSSED10-310 bacterium]|uniref:Polysaccharide biosynthesis C-terminal domain-containing protein n=1 Tax=candidate division CSSED10-310 bacterium TaxID=2855610 RepID=A0ABV6YRJ5_UNCC1
MERQNVFRVTIRNFTFRFGADVIHGIVSALVTILLANYLGVEDNGRYNLVYSYLYIFIILSELGLAPIVMRELSKADVGGNKFAGSEILGNAIIIKILLIVFTFVLATPFVLLFPSLLSVRKLIWIALFSLFFNWSFLFGAAFESQLKLEYPSLIKLGCGLTTSLIIFGLIILRAPLWSFILLRTGVLIPELFLYLKYLKPLVPWSFRFSLPLSKFLIKESLPLLASNMCIALYLRIDQLILNHFYDETAVGVYAAAVHIVEAFRLFPLAFMIVTAPLLAQYFVKNRDKFQRFYNDCFRLVNIICWPMALGGTLLAQSIIALIYKVEFADAYAPFAILLWGNIFVYLGTVNNKLLIVTGKQLLDIVFTGSALTVNIVFNFILIPRYGLIGAAAASVMAYATGPIMGYFIKTTRNYSRAMLMTSGRPAIAALLMVLVIFPVRQSLLLALPLGIILYPIFLRMIGGISTEDWALIKSLRKNSPR